MELKISKEYEKLNDPLTEEEYEALKASIKEVGQQIEIIVSKDGTVLDGHHRFKICQELGIEPKFRVEAPTDEISYVLIANLLRRHYNDFQKAQRGMLLLEREKELAKERQGHKTSASNDAEVKKDIKAVGQVSKQIGLSQSTFERAQKVIEKGPAGLLDLVKNEQLSIYGGYRLVQALEKVPEKTKKAFENRVIEADRPEEELMKVIDIVQETNVAKSFLEMTSEEVAKKIEDQYKNQYYTEALDAHRVQHDIQVAEGG